jgi:signal transduction histidine kinase
VCTMIDASPFAPDPDPVAEEVARGLFGTGRRMVRTHPLVTDALLAAALLAVSTAWLAGSRFAGAQAVALQCALVLPLALRRMYPSAVFVITCTVAFLQWSIGDPLLGDLALLVALYTVAVHEKWGRAVLASAVLEVGVVLASIRWVPAGTVPRSIVFLTATVVAALFAGLTVDSGSRYLDWMEERARRLEFERDQQAVIAAATERTRIARELHDIVSHSLSVVINLADAATVVSRSDPERGSESLVEIAELGRNALSDMRAMFGVLRTDEPAELSPTPGTAQLVELVERIRSTGLAVQLDVVGTPFPLGPAAELTVYRIVQEAMTNSLRHASAGRIDISLAYAAPEVRIDVSDDGIGSPSATLVPGQGIRGMRERASLFGGELRSGPVPDGGWSVSTVLRVDRTAPMIPVAG